MKFWDSSAVVPLLIEEAGTPRYSAVYARDAGMIVWWATEAECVAALSRWEREAGEEGRLAVADAFQLAAALAACEGMPATLEFVCADARLIAAARLEGFSIIAPEIAA